MLPVKDTKFPPSDLPILLASIWTLVLAISAVFVRFSFDQRRKIENRTRNIPRIKPPLDSINFSKPLWDFAITYLSAMKITSDYLMVRL
jgi:hypothetical protein